MLHNVKKALVNLHKDVLPVFDSFGGVSEIDPKALTYAKKVI